MGIYSFKDNIIVSKLFRRSHVNLMQEKHHAFWTIWGREHCCLSFRHSHFYFTFNLMWAEYGLITLTTNHDKQNVNQSLHLNIFWTEYQTVLSASIINTS